MKRQALELEIPWGVEAPRMSDRIIDEGIESRVHHRYIQAFTSAPVLAIRKLNVCIRDNGYKAITGEISPTLLPWGLQSNSSYHHCARSSLPLTRMNFQQSNSHRACSNG